ncbi:MAG: hypothetical protein ACYSR4_02045 [Planctomycetota bacterium]
MAAIDSAVAGAEAALLFLTPLTFLRAADDLDLVLRLVFFDFFDFTFFFFVPVILGADLSNAMLPSLKLQKYSPNLIVLQITEWESYTVQNQLSRSSSRTALN